MLRGIRAAEASIYKNISWTCGVLAAWEEAKQVIGYIP